MRNYILQTFKSHKFLVFPTVVLSFLWICMSLTKYNVRPIFFRLLFFESLLKIRKISLYLLAVINPFLRTPLLAWKTKMATKRLRSYIKLSKQWWKMKTFTKVKKYFFVSMCGVYCFNSCACMWASCVV